MANLPVPDYVGTILAYLRSQSDVTDICPAANIRGKIPDNAINATYYIVPSKSGGGADPYAPVFSPRVDFKCYGPTEYEAMRLWSWVHPTLIPTDRMGTRILNGSCLISGIVFEAGPTELVDEDSGWPFVLATYVFTVSPVP